MASSRLPVFPGSPTARPQQCQRGSVGGGRDSEMQQAVSSPDPWSTLCYLIHKHSHCATELWHTPSSQWLSTLRRTTKITPVFLQFLVCPLVRVYTVLLIISLCCVSGECFSSSLKNANLPEWYCSLFYPVLGVKGTKFTFWFQVARIFFTLYTFARRLPVIVPFHTAARIVRLIELRPHLWMHFHKQSCTSGAAWSNRCTTTTWSNSVLSPIVWTLPC